MWRGGNSGRNNETYQNSSASVNTGGRVVVVMSWAVATAMQAATNERHFMVNMLSGVVAERLKDIGLVYVASHEEEV
jgi:hypothetical protein